MADTVTPTPPTTTGARMDAGTLEQWLTRDADVRVLDVRSPAEFEGVHIPGAYNVPLDTLGEHASDIQRHVDERMRP